METIAQPTAKNARDGRLEWIGIRPARREPLTVVDEIVLQQTGLTGDHYQSGGKRTVSLIQHEHLAAIASLLGREAVVPEDLRRNLVVSGINLLGLRNRQFKIGDCILEGSGICAPCSRMEETLGHGGYTAMRGHGGITARVIKPGNLRFGDPVTTITS